MAKKIESLIKYEEKIKELPIASIGPNSLNPRKRFVESEEDELIESIISKGVLNPIIVFKREKDGKYTILDGERRYKACKKLGISTIPAHVLVREPSDLENLSIMFHIHNVREEWTDFAVSITIKRIVEEMGKDIRKLNVSDIKELSKTTSLSDYKVRKYLKFLDYPIEIVNRFLEAEKQDKPIRGVDPDILYEMHKPIKEIQRQMPEILEKYPVSKIIDVCVKKKAQNIIENNKEFRLLSKALTASKRGEIRKEALRDKIIDFIENIEITPKTIYEVTSQAVYQFKVIIKSSNKLYEEISNLNLKKLTVNEKEELKKILHELSVLIQGKFLR